MKLLIITYHYFGKENTHQRGIYPMSPERFSRQLDAIVESGWQFISEDDLVSAILGTRPLPTKSCLITFDDALRSQYELAVPILLERGIPAVFFAPTRHLEEPRAYMVHQIHYLLSKVSALSLLAEFEKTHQDVVGTPFDWSGADSGRATGHYQYDDPDTARFKFIVNHVLSRNVAESVVEALFKRVHGDQAAFSESLYLSEDEMNRMHSHELLSFGVHTHNHSNALQEDAETLGRDMAKNYSMLRDKVGTTARGIAYPFGSVTPELYEQKLKSAVLRLGLSYGLTTERKINESLAAPFLLGRLSAEDIPFGKRPLLTI